MAAAVSRTQISQDQRQLDRVQRLRLALLQKKLDRTLVLPAESVALSSEEREARLLASGWASVDRALSGGFPRGECSEIVGSPSSGRTALLTTLLAEATRRGEIVALVDTLDRFDPRAAVEMAAPLGDPLVHPWNAGFAVGGPPLDLSRMLWVRGTPLSPQALGAQKQKPSQKQKRASRIPSISIPRGERPSRIPRLPLLNGREFLDEEPELLGRVIDRAVKAFGLIAQAGGFGVVALDLADVPMPALRRLPFTTWFRLQRVIEGSQTVGILLAPEPLGRSARGVTVRLGPGKGAGKGPGKDAMKGAAKGADEDPREGANEVTRVVWTGTNDCARVLTGFALQPQVQSARRLGDQLRDVPSVAAAASA